MQTCTHKHCLTGHQATLVVLQTPLSQVVRGGAEIPSFVITDIEVALAMVHQPFDPSSYHLRISRPKHQKGQCGLQLLPHLRLPPTHLELPPGNV